MKIRTFVLVERLNLITKNYVKESHVKVVNSIVIWLLFFYNIPTSIIVTFY